MKNKIALLLTVLITIVMTSCKDDENDEYSYKALYVDAYVYAEVYSVNQDQIYLSIPHSTKNEEALKAYKLADSTMGLVFQSTPIWISTKDWPTTIKVGDEIKFKIIAYGVQMNYEGAYLDLPPIRLWITPDL